MDLIVENVRCFAGRHVAPLAPITILVGENSTGKSTFLAMARVAWDAMNRWDLIDFNDEPFRLGAFDDIVTTTKSGKSETFAVGYRFAPRTADNRRVSPSLEDVEVRILFSGRDAQPALKEWRVRSGKYEIAHSSTGINDEKAPILTINGPLTNLSFTARDLPMAPSVMALSQYWHFFRMRMTSEAKGLFGDQEGKPASKEDLEIFDLLVSSVNLGLRYGRPSASAPIRTRPLRTYDPVTDKANPEGAHVPMLLAKAMATRSNPQWSAIVSGLYDFGSAAGLFKSIDVKRMGGDEANLPFQVRIGVADGPKFNLVDVGYGVSQVLPIWADAVTNKNRMLLLQQPEVHLHPRAQAELGSFLARLASEHQSAPLLIETHSDYLLDRIRMDVRDKKGITENDIIILYFSRGDTGVQIHAISIDKHGNLINPPSGYRDFFLAEERRFLQG